jgi:hypothetical protein
MSPLTTDFDCIKAVHDLYLSWYGSERFTYTVWDDSVVEVDYIDVMQLYFSCAKMKRWEDDEVCIRSLLKKMRIIE